MWRLCGVIHYVSFRCKHFFSNQFNALNSILTHYARFICEKLVDRGEVTNMASIFDVARYIVDKQGRVTTMKLQKLCYYSQAWTLVWDEEPLFNEDFQAWANGPVNADLFKLHKGQFVVEEGFLHDQTSGDALTEEQMQNIDEVLDYYGDKNPH